MKQFIKNSILLYLLIIAIDVFFLPINVTKVGEMLLPTGSAVNLLYICGGICIATMLVIFFKNIKNMRNKKFVPLYLLILMFGVIVLVQKLFPELLIINAAFVFITFVMYFTIENPDLKIIDELNKNRLLVNKTTEDKSNFLFLASSQLKNPIKQIEEISRSTIELKNTDEIKENVREINNLSQNLSVLVNNALDISSLSYSNIKIINDKYNLPNLIEKIKLLEEKKISSSIEFRVNISDTIPKYLYGDSKLLEQVLISILENSIKYTKEGFIELRLNTIIKYDMARLIFTIEDSGQGMSIDKVNDLLLIDENLNEEEIKRLETNNVNMNTIKKLVAKLGGYFTIKSEVNKGTEVKVIIDQRIEEDNKLLVNNYINKERILVAVKDKELLNSITRILNSYGYDVENSIYANDIIDRIRLKDEFSYIFIDDNLDSRAFVILKELKKDKKFKIPVIIILDKDMEMIKDHFKEDGFKDYILKENLKSDIERVLK